jgi:hypothetical protein
MAAPTIISTTNTRIIQNIQTEYLQMYNTSNLTTEKSNTYRLLNMRHCFNTFYQFLKRVCTTILIVLAPQVLRNVSPFGFDEILPNLAYVPTDRQRNSMLFVCTWVIGSTICSEWFTLK